MLKLTEKTIRHNFFNLKGFVLSDSKINRKLEGHIFVGPLNEALYLAIHENYSENPNEVVNDLRQISLIGATYNGVFDASGKHFTLSLMRNFKASSLKHVNMASFYNDAGELVVIDDAFEVVGAGNYDQIELIEP